MAPRRPWTPEEDALIFLYPIAQTARMTNRTVKAIYERRHVTRHPPTREASKRLRLEYDRATLPAPRTGQPWCSWELKLIENPPRHWSMVRVAQELGRTYSAVTVKRSKL